MQQYYFQCTKTVKISKIIFISPTLNQGNGQKVTKYHDWPDRDLVFRFRKNLENLNSTIYKPTYNVNRYQTVAPSGPRFGGAFGRVAVAAGNFIRRFLRPPTAVQRPFLRFMRPRRLQPIATKFMVDPAQVNLRL